MRCLVLLATLLFASPALAEDPCAGRNPLYCAPRPPPIIVESVRVKPEGSLSTRHDIIVRQGDRILYVRKGKDTNWNISDVPKEPDYDE